MKRKSAIPVLCLLVFLLLPGCRNNDSDETNMNLPPNYRQEQIVTKLELEKSQSVPKCLAIGNGKVLMAHTDEAAGRTRLELYDVTAKDLIPAPDVDDVVIPSRFLEGNKVLLNSETDIYVLSLDSGTVEKVNVPQPFGVFSHDMNDYYYVKDYVLYRMNLKSGACEVIKNEYNMRVASIDGIHPDNDLLSVMVYPSSYEMDACGAVIDPESGNFLVLHPQIQEPVYVGEKFYNIFYGNEGETPGIHCGSLSEEQNFKIIPIPELQMQDSPIITLLDYSDYAIVQYSDNEERIELWKLEDTVKKCCLFQYGLKGLLENPIYLPNAKLIMGYVYNGDAYEAVLIDPSKADFQVGKNFQILEDSSLIDETIIAAHYAEQNWDCPEHLQDVQIQAELLEKKYDIDILLGIQCQKPLENFSLETVICEDAVCIQNGLNDLERALLLYPDNFFRQFLDSSGNGGVTFLLAQIMDDPLGYANFQGDRYYIVIDISGCQHISVYSTYCHELWHSMESFICRNCPDAFDEETWTSFNPDSFQYYENYELDVYSESNEWILAFSEPGDAYFTDNYGKVNSMEDRARIMEWVMTGENSVKDFRENRHLGQKLQFMADAVRQAFDTSGWKIPRWEEPLN